MRISDWSSDVCSSDLHRRMIDAEHGEAVEGDVLDEDLEAAMQRFLAAVELHVLGVDVGDHGDGGGQLHEAAVALVRLDHHPVAGAEEIGRASCRERVCQYV